MLAYGLTVCLGGVTLVLVPVVGGVFLVNLLHEVITVGLGKDAGSGYAEELTVPLHYGGVGEGLAARAEGERTFQVIGFRRSSLGNPLAESVAIYDDGFVD